ncbi:cytochrome o ubiquinol oxidase subunit I [Francisella tularensis]|uniref:Cytochrome bo(3) ubiquinol oxidase subunit 1 n=3 Tax=Francisella tularensis TaxID=263 RepID=Q5NI10_FRATT|nr:cytochrome o ubiquinol oxidase subunit I [Francisella tularensis]ABO47472.1 cytochrome o ubiquinol oxidase, subunit I [Francisella tularensis subsp. tularensis WY96-3418]ADA77969.1 cytochrome o ubiquinol oxidase, subunit I [Francisella tularensis subsp. tularensis NE061598]AFB78383.1 Cytochrome O ubiquinol oxidase subunit I [Francisella tularensis subsp. tularensis TIGB03]AFB78461.1 Cytochrome O ubiquinol oxidase subunit I [Francisella tularensis subsp. tularensis TIGB03]AFB80006.1 Cytochro
MLEALIGKLNNPHLVFPYLYEPVSQQLIILTMFIGIVVAGVALLGGITYFRKWGYLWNEWFTTIDHKKIGTMYTIVALVMMFRGFVDAAMMRTQQALASGDSTGYLIPEHFDQIFSAHGVIMIFFVAMPLIFALMNWVIPLQIGARDVAFPYMNSLSFWLFVVGAMLINISLLVGDFAHAGWLAYPPFSETTYSPTVGTDYYIWGLQISGIGSLMTGINFFVTIIKMRCKGMTLMKMPIFTWASLCSVILVVAAFPVLTVTLGLLTLDRYFGTHFFTVSGGGDQMMYVNLIWIWGHPEVYILVLPLFGVFSEVAATFSKKPLFGYTTMVWASIVITILSFTVWLHHFFTMGASANVNAFFGIMTMIIAIPTGVKIFNWLFTMYKGRITFATPMMWLIGFMIVFSVGGMTGVLLSVPGVDFQMHNSVFLIAHFHNVIIGGVVFGAFSGLTFWFPKIFGFKLNERLGKYSLWCWFIGFFVAFMPLYILGTMGMTRRLYHYDAATGYQPLLIVAWVGAMIIGLGILLQIIQIFVSIKQRDQNRVGADAWGYGRTLEWGIPSPVPFYNFSHDPVVEKRDAYWGHKQKGLNVDNTPVGSAKKYEDIHMPKNTAVGVIIGAFSFVFGFAAVWHIWWLAIVGVVGIIGTVLYRSFDYDIDYYVKADQVKEVESRYNQQGELQV